MTDERDVSEMSSGSSSADFQAPEQPCLKQQRSTSTRRAYSSKLWCIDTLDRKQHLRRPCKGLGQTLGDA